MRVVFAVRVVLSIAKKIAMISGKGVYIPQRYVFGLLGFLALSNAYIQRFNLSLTITEMTHPVFHSAKDKDTYECSGELIVTNSTKSVSMEIIFRFENL